MFTDGNGVCVLYDLVTSNPTAALFIAEWFQVKEGRTASTRVVSDPIHSNSCFKK